MDEKTIDITTYKKGQSTIISYTGTFCNPCKRVKPGFLEYIDKKSYKLEQTHSIKKDDYKKLGPEYKFVPFFVVSNGSNSLKNIQTSNLEELTKFLDDFFRDDLLDDF